MNTKILMISDIHFGCRGNSEKYLTIMSEFFTKTLMNVVNDYDLTDIRILGDLFDNRNTLNVRTINVVMETFEHYRIMKPDVKFTILIGNHDQYYHNRSDINSLNILKNMPNVQIIDKIEIEKIGSKKIVMVPWLIPESNNYNTFTSMTNGEDKFDLLLGHFEVRGFEISPGIVDINGMDTGIFKNFTRVFSGHYHLRDTRGNMTYLGCPYQLTWGDYGNDKGIHIYDIDTEEVTFIKNNDSPEHIKINISDIATGDRKCLKKVKNNIVKLVIDKKYNDSAIVKVISVIESLQPFKLDIDNQYIEEDVDSKSLKDVDLSRLNDPLSFLLEYIKVIEIPTDYEITLDKKELANRVAEMYRKILKEKD